MVTTETNPLTDLLRPYVPELKAESEAGNKKAEQVIDLYLAYAERPTDPGAAARCNAAFHEWMVERNAPSKSAPVGAVAPGSTAPDRTNKRTLFSVLGKDIGTGTGWDMGDTFEIMIYDLERNDLGKKFAPDFPDGGTICINFDGGKVYSVDDDGKETAYKVDWSVFNDTEKPVQRLDSCNND